MSYARSSTSSNTSVADSLDRCIKRARCTKSVQGLQTMLAHAECRVEDARKMGWQALAQSWAQTAAHLGQVLDEIKPQGRGW